MNKFFFFCDILADVGPEQRLMTACSLVSITSVLDQLDKKHKFLVEAHGLLK